MVKADAYGLGMQQAASALSRAGCKTFFVATLAEAIALRALLPRATIYVFSGLMRGTAEIYRAALAVDEVVDALVVDLPRPGTQGFMPLRCSRVGSVMRMPDPAALA